MKKNLLQKNPYLSKGFTLLELLVVIGIIGLLVSVAVVSYSSAQIRTRDSRRKADLGAMRDALEQYYAATGLQYPATCNSAATTYLKGSWPVDPGTGTYYEYCDTDSYYICATLESTTGGNASARATNSNGAGLTWGSGQYYCVSSLQ